MKKTTSARTLCTLGGVLFGLFSPLATAQVRDEYGEIHQTVARISYLSGEVSFSRGDDPDDWQPADRNVPMTLGDRIYTGSRSRIELQVHGGGRGADSLELGRRDGGRGDRRAPLRHRGARRTRRLGPVGEPAGLPPDARTLVSVRQRGHRRRGRPRRVRPLGASARLRMGLVSNGRRRRLGPLPLGALDLAGPLGLDLGFRRAVGLGALPLRSLGNGLVALVLGAGRVGRSLCQLLAGSRRLRRRRTRLVRFGFARRRRIRRMVPARPTGSLLPLVGRPGPRELFERQSQRRLRQQNVRDRG